MKVLDLFCGVGGAAKGIKVACPEADIIGIDIQDFKDVYPYRFIQADIQTFNELKNFDFIWASPPCQGYSWATIKWRNKGKKYPDLISFTRDLLLKSGKPYVIENVPNAPIRKDLMLCGEMFGLKVIRHRIFEINGFNCPQPKHIKHKGSVWHGEYIGVWTGGRPGCFGNEQHRKYYTTVAGHGGDGGKGNCSLQAFQDAMGINWTKDKKAICEAVHPKYSEYIFNQFLSFKAGTQQTLG